MSLAYIRRVYRVPAFRGRRVRIMGYGEGRITSGTAYIYVRFDGKKRSRPFHPTWQVTYLEGKGMPQIERVKTWRTRLSYYLECRNCLWRKEQAKSSHAAMRHHRKTGHVVRLEVSFIRYYGESSYGRKD